MPTLTPELELELEPVLLVDELELLLFAEELVLELPDDLPPPLLLELPAALTLKCPLPAGRCKAILPSMGANPTAIVISQRVRFIVLSVLSVRASPPARRAMPAARKNHDNPRAIHKGEETPIPGTSYDLLHCIQLEWTDRMSAQTIPRE
jgi:hypothetical protein